MQIVFLECLRTGTSLYEDAVFVVSEQEQLFFTLIFFNAYRIYCCTFKEFKIRALLNLIH